jgi:hypothetical protein
VEGQNYLMGQRRVVDVGRRDKVMEKFTTWLRDVWGRPDVGKGLSVPSEERKGGWANQVSRMGAWVESGWLSLWETPVGVDSCIHPSWW